MAITGLESMSGSQTNINAGVTENISRINNNGVGLDDLRNLKNFYYVSTSASFTIQYSTGERQYIAVSSASALTITLPPTSAAPTNGFMVIIADTTQNSETYNITIARNGNTINGASSNLTIAVNGSCVWLVYSGSNNYDLMFSGLTDTLIPINTTVDIGTSTNPFRYGYFDSLGLSNSVVGTQLAITKIKTGSAPDIYLRQARDGSTATQANDSLGGYYAMGHTGSIFLGPTVGVTFTARENFTGSAAGSKISFRACPNGSLTLTELWSIQDGALFPVPNGTEDIGGSSNQVDNIYLVNAPIVSSDPINKDNVKSFDESGINPLEFIEKLNSLNGLATGKRKKQHIPARVYKLVKDKYRYEPSDYIPRNHEIIEIDPDFPENVKVYTGRMGSFIREEKHDYIAKENEYVTPGRIVNHSRTHTWIMADKVYQALKESNISTKNFAGLVIDNSNGLSFDKNGETLETPDGKPVGEMGIRYDEFIPLALAAIAQLSEKVKILESRLGI